jgi:hypothetical protein
MACLIAAYFFDNIRIAHKKQPVGTIMVLYVLYFFCGTINEKNEVYSIV